MSQLPDNIIETDQYPFYRLYQQVKERDRETGHATVDLPSYFLLLETLQKGYMLLSPESIVLLCEKIWLKPYHLQSTVLNKEVLKQLVMEALALAGQVIDAPKEQDTTPMPKPPEPTPPSRTKPKKTAPLPPKQPLPPSEMDKAMSSRQGHLNISVTMADESPGATPASQPAGNQMGEEEQFLVKGSYLPVNPRRLEQSIRSYRYLVKGHGIKEIDWEATINQIAGDGYFDQFTYKEKDHYGTNWTVLIDLSPSMAAFTAYSEEIAEAVTRGDAADQDNIFYFSNCPLRHLYYDRRQSASLPLDRFTKGRKRNILIVSDAGAARGYFNEQRLLDTILFLRSLQRHRIAWMNPMPRERWVDSSAELIAAYTNMFDVGEGSQDNLGNIVRLFKSKITTGKL